MRSGPGLCLKPIGELTAVPGPLPGFDCKRQSLRPTGQFLKWPMALKRLDSTGLIDGNRLSACYVCYWLI